MPVDPYWSSDVPISMPVPPTSERMVSMDGFVMTPTHLAHDINWVDFQQMSTPTYSPKDFGLETVYEDEGLDLDPMNLETF